MGNSAAKEQPLTSSSRSGNRRQSSSSVVDSTSPRRSSRQHRSSVHRHGSVSSADGHQPSSSSAGLSLGLGHTSSKFSVRHVLNLDDQVDGGYLVPQGVYSGPQDFKARIVRQLMIDRKLAPFYKGLEDFEEDWSDVQLLAAIHGQPIPPPVAAEPSLSTPSAVTASSPLSTPDLSSSSAPPLSPTSPLSATFPSTSSTSEVPGRGRSQSVAESTKSSASIKSLVKSRSRASTGGSSSDMKKSTIELTLYRNAIECPICFLYYPPWINSTRCCDQPICSECFVQIRRADPHIPEHETDDVPGSNDGSAARSSGNANANTTPFGMIELISESASCPYCAEPDFGITYTPPPFRSGMSSSSPGAAIRATLMRQSNASNSSTSLNSNSTIGSPPVGGITANRLRRPSIPSTSSDVVTTDRIRPDWVLKLANANAQAVRRAAAATALHTAAFLGGDDSRGSHGSTRHRSRLLRRTSASGGGSGGGVDSLIIGSGGGRSGTSSTNSSGTNLSILGRPMLSIGGGGGSPTRISSRLAGSPTSPSRRSGTGPRQMADLEEMMVMEAIRISLLEAEATQNSNQPTPDAHPSSDTHPSEAVHSGTNADINTDTNTDSQRDISVHSENRRSGSNQTDLESLEVHGVTAKVDPISDSETPVASSSGNDSASTAAAQVCKENSPPNSKIDKPVDDEGPKEPLSQVQVKKETVGQTMAV
ncbi:uncharacterized protein V1516DRAFT_686724 [Lipomyces oligophaga]|uniref:uncharacterized protein n=1 Tax=Lipomyces oligophaga TaxID=45792 RepID=UPI0034CE001B